MTVKQAIENRRAIKHFDDSYEIPDDDFDSLMSLVLQAPSSFNIQHWRFVDVVDIEKRHKIREAAWNQEQITTASKLLILCADVKAWEKNPSQYSKNSPASVSEMMVPMIKGFYEGREWIQRDEAMRSVGIAAQTLMLAAQELGYDTCPMIGFDQDKVSQIINLPDDHVIGMIIVLGTRKSEPHSRGGTIDYSKAIIKNNF